jgi:hypothetical protein
MDNGKRERIMRANGLGILAILTWLLATAGAAPPSQATSQQTPVVRMVLRVLATPLDGPAVEQASSDVELALGQSGAITFATPTNLCAVAIGSAPERITIASPRHVWTVRFTLTSARTDKIAVDVEVRRQDDISQSTRESIRHLVLTEGAPHVLDFVESSDQSCRAANMVIEVLAALIDPPETAQRLLSYDLWLTHRDASGREWTRHEARTTRQGERAEFRFQPLRWTTTSLVPSLNVDETVAEEVFGSIRGRVRGDGQLEVSFTTARRFVHGSGSTGEGSGVKVFTARPGEAVSIELPSPRGRSSAMSTSGSRTFLDYQELFKGHTTAVVLTVNLVSRP